MSGGVDSSVAAYLMMQQGFECSGATMKLLDNTPCSIEDMEDARNVAESLGIPFYIYDFTGDFKKHVVSRFIEVYQDGATPNPCIDCNRCLKYGEFLRNAMLSGMDYIATGHYARIEYETESGRYLLKKAIDESKDQSYVLYFMTQEQLAHTFLPLAGLYKKEVRGIAEKQGFSNAAKRDSQDICFVRDGDYAGFIERYTGKACQSGDFVDVRGTALGRHKGLIWYTVGQRKGLGLPLQKPMYVLTKNAENNTVTLCEEDELFTKSLEAADFNWIAFEKTDLPIRAKAKIRYRQKEQWATAVQTSDGIVRIEFDQPQRAIAKGQAVVLYDGDTVLGGGTII